MYREDSILSRPFIYVFTIPIYDGTVSYIYQAPHKHLSNINQITWNVTGYYRTQSAANRRYVSLALHLAVCWDIDIITCSFAVKTMLLLPGIHIVCPINNLIPFYI